MRNPSTKFINSKTIFTSSLIAIVVTTILVYLTGLKVHRSIIDNSLISLSCLAVCFWTFTSYGLYNGLRIKENVGDISRHIKFVNSDSGGTTNISIDTPDVIDSDDFISGILASILLWILISLISILLIFFFETIIWAILIIFTAMLYWIFYRAIKIVFKNSKNCKNDLAKSVLTGIWYTCLYTSWIYGVIFTANLFR